MTASKAIGKIRVEHNHGVVILRDAVFHEYENREGGYLLGTVEAGATTSRLFQHMHTTEEKVGEQRRVDYIDPSRIYPCRRDEHWVSICFCG